MDDYRIALLFSILVLVPLAGWKITSMVKKLHSMSRRGKEENDGLTPKQKEFIEFLEKASNQSKENNDAWCEIKFWFRWCRNEIQDHWNFSDFWFKRYCFYLVFLLFRSYLTLAFNQLFVYRYKRMIWKFGQKNYYLRVFDGTRFDSLQEANNYEERLKNQAIRSLCNHDYEGWEDYMFTRSKETN